MNYKDYISIFEDFPKKGISFKDISPLLASKSALESAVNDLAELAKKYNPDYILAPESRGFLLGVPVAYKLNIGFVMARKPGKLPGDLAKVSYGLEYGSDELYVQKDLLKEGKRYLIIDDLLATGGTVTSLVNLLKDHKCIPTAVLCIVELTDLNGTKGFEPVPFESLVKYNK